MKLTWEYYTRNLEKVTVTLEPDKVNLDLISDLARMLGVISKDEEICIGKPLTEFPSDNEGLRNED